MTVALLLAWIIALAPIPDLTPRADAPSAAPPAETEKPRLADGEMIRDLCQRGTPPIVIGRLVELLGRQFACWHSCDLPHVVVDRNSRPVLRQDPLAERILLTEPSGLEASCPFRPKSKPPIPANSEPTRSFTPPSGLRSRSASASHAEAPTAPTLSSDKRGTAASSSRQLGGSSRGRNLCRPAAQHWTSPTVSASRLLSLGRRPGRMISTPSCSSRRQRERTTMWRRCRSVSLRSPMGR